MPQDSVQDFNFVLFGATGNLSLSKLIPALSLVFFHAVHNISNIKVLCIGKELIDTEGYLDKAYDVIMNKGIKINDDVWDKFAMNVEYFGMDITNSGEYDKLKAKLNININNIFYFATPPHLFEVIASSLACCGLNHDNARIVLEKPLGDCLESATAINKNISKYFKEHQIFRIDHYLGKDSVQNLLAIRFSNTIFEGLWNKDWIKSVQITVAEDEGIAGRGAFYDHIGALRDVLQNHLLQLLCFIGMEAPSSLEADVIRDRKLEVLKSLRAFRDAPDVLHNVVSGQYINGIIHNRFVRAYTEENGISMYSRTETFVALKTYIDNSRWSGVPFYLRTGKRLAKRVAEVVIHFKDIENPIFNNKTPFANKLIIQLQPNDNIKLYFFTKEYGTYSKVQGSYLDLSMSENSFMLKEQSGYYRLLLDIIKGKLGLFVREDEQLCAWQFVEPILDTWHTLKIVPKLYEAGSWGPAEANTLLVRDGNYWYENFVGSKHFE
jgi:glucose-6-phosphate 1-dehydrogenase